MRLLAIVSLFAKTSKKGIEPLLAAISKGIPLPPPFETKVLESLEKLLLERIEAVEEAEQTISSIANQSLPIETAVRRCNEVRRRHYEHAISQVKVMLDELTRRKATKN